MAAGVGQVGGVGVEVLAAAAAVVLRVEQDDVARPAGERVAQVVEGAVGDPIAVGAMTTPRARAPPVAADADLGFGQITGPVDAESRAGTIFAGSWHGVPPEKTVLPGDTLSDGKMFIVPARFPCYRLKKFFIKSDLALTSDLSLNMLPLRRAVGDQCLPLM